MKELKVVHYGVVELGKEVKVSDPCYGTTVWCSYILDDVSAGHYDCYTVIAETGSCGKRVAFMVLCKDGYGFNIPKEQIPCDIGVDAGVCGIYDLEYFNQYHNDRDVNEDWYQNNVISWCMKDQAYICDEGKGFITSSGYGDGGYMLLVDRNDNGEIVRIAVDYFVTEDDTNYELIFEEK